MTATEAREDPGSDRVALKTSLDGPRAWFVFDPKGGGHYAPGTRSPDKVDDWPAYSFTPPEEDQE